MHPAAWGNQDRRAGTPREESGVSQGPAVPSGHRGENLRAISGSWHEALPGRGASAVRGLRGGRRVDQQPDEDRRAAEETLGPPTTGRLVLSASLGAVFSQTQVEVSGNCRFQGLT